jgi:hypothetical protein
MCDCESDGGLIVLICWPLAADWRKSKRYCVLRSLEEGERITLRCSWV